MSEVTRILNRIASEPKAADELIPLVYDELRRLASRKMSMEPAGQTIQATALVHDAYIRLVGEKEQQWKNRTHFYAVAAEVMRRILVDRARKRKSVKHGGDLNRHSLDRALKFPTRARKIHCSKSTRPWNFLQKKTPSGLRL